MNKIYWQVCQELFGEGNEYYHHWYHERPIIISPERTQELRQLHCILYKCIEYMANHYTQFVDKYMPLSPKEMEILAYQSQFPFKAGTYRPDYLITPAGELKLCEITSRFFAHGIFMSYYAESAADEFIARHPGTHRDSRFEEMMQYMLKIVGDKQKIYVLKSSDKTSEIKLYKPFYEYFGKTVTIYEADQVEENINKWNGNFVISALNQKDLLSYSMETIKAMIDSGMYSDFRTIFLSHDKRFMRMWFEDDFTGNFLTAEESQFIREHSIQTYVCAEKAAEGAMADAYLHKDHYILKHHCLGKSEKVYAGPLTTDSEWKELFDSGATKDMIMQPFLEQRKFPTIWEGAPFDDYACGMMLCVDDKFFDSGLFRASSCPVTNKVDDRKICPVATNCDELYPYGDLL